MEYGVNPKDVDKLNKNNPNEKIPNKKMKNLKLKKWQKEWDELSKQNNPN